jgi:GrpB protein
MTEEDLRAAWVVAPPKLAGKIQVVDYDPQWPRLFQREADRIRAALGERVAQLEHVGSTSVPGLAAKPVIDILLIVPDSSDEPAYLPDLQAAGYVLVIREPDWYEHRCLKGPGTAVNLHVYSPGARRSSGISSSATGCGPTQATALTTSRSNASWPSGTGPMSSSTPTPRARSSTRSSPGPGSRRPAAEPGSLRPPPGVHNSFTAGRQHRERPKQRRHTRRNAMRRMMVVGAVILAIVAVVGIGVAAFNAGVDEGISRELAQSGNGDEVVRVVGHGYGWGYGRGFGFPFGLILFPLFIIGIVLLVRGAFARGRWGGPRWWGPGGWGPGGPGGPGGYGPPGPWGGPAAFDEYHRRLHEQPRTPAGPDDAPPGSTTRESPADPGTA